MLLGRENPSKEFGDPPMRRCSLLLATVSTAMLVACAGIGRTETPPPNVRGKLVAVAVVGSPPSISFPMSAASIGAIGTLGTLVLIPLALTPSPFGMLPATGVVNETSGKLKCADTLQEKFPEFEQEFRAAFAREFAASNLGEHFANEVRERTASKVILINRPSNENKLVKSSARAQAAVLGANVLITLEEIQIDLRGLFLDPHDHSKGCDRWQLGVSLKVQALDISADQSPHSESIEFSCKDASLEQLSRWMREVGTLSEELVECYSKIAPWVLYFNPSAEPLERL